MTDRQIAAALREYNRWRRGAEDLEQPAPTTLGRLLDLAAERLEAHDQFPGAGKMVGKRGKKPARSGQPLVN